MPGLFTTMATAANSLGVYDKVLSTISNNINNSGTAGYAKQRLSTTPQPFDPASGLSGGVSTGDLESSRSVYAERAVWRNEFSYAASAQLSTELSNIEPLFNVTGTAGIPGALSSFFSTVSSWSVTPNDSVSRTTVINSADELAQSFNSMASGLTSAVNSVDDRIRSTVDSINALATQIASINREIMNDASNANDPSVDARMYNALESLSEYGDFSILKQSNGTTTVLLGGQTPLVIEDQSSSVEADTSGTSAVLYDSEGRDVTAQLSGGRLATLYEVRNTVLPAYENQLNQLAAGLADSVNNLLASGLDENGVAGAALFSYDSADSAAFTLKVTDITPEELAGASSSSAGGNANALALVALANTAQVNGLSFTAYYSSMTSQFGQVLSAAKDSTATAQDLVEQARSMRSDISSVSLDEEATMMLQYQRSYQATARLITVLNELTQTTIDLLH
jgi:flagellar hook-associated protein 1 FlgK